MEDGKKREKGSSLQNKVAQTQYSKGVTGGPSGPSREGPGVGHKIVSDTEQMTNKREKKEKNK